MNIEDEILDFINDCSPAPGYFRLGRQKFKELVLHAQDIGRFSSMYRLQEFGKSEPILGFCGYRVVVDKLIPEDSVVFVPYDHLSGEFLEPRGLRLQNSGKESKPRRMLRPI